MDNFDNAQSSAKIFRYSPTPLILPVLMWTFGLILGRYSALPAHFWLAGIILFFIPALFIKKGRNLFILMIFLLLGAYRISLKDAQISPLKQSLRDQGKSRQEMSYEVQSRLGEKSYQVQLIEIGGMKTQEQAILFGEDELEIGEVYGSLSDLEYIYSDPILDVYPTRFVGSVRAVLPPQKLESKTKRRIVESLRQKISDRLDNTLKNYSPLAKALLIGDGDFKKEHRQSLSRAGITHLVVVSGLHVLMLAMIALMLLRLIFPRKPAELLFMLFLLGFAALNNWAPPIVRAMIMIDLLILSRWLSRMPNSGQTLALALFIITLISPDQFFSLGLQMSFLCVAIIVFALPKLRVGEGLSLPKRGFRWLANYLILTIYMGIGLAPLTLYHFGTASLNSLLGNLLGIPLIYLLLSLSLLILAVPVQAFILSYKFICDIWQAWLNICASLPFHIEGNWISLPMALALACTLILIFMAIRGKFRLLLRAGLPLGLLAIILFLIPTKHKNELYIFNAGVADCSLIFADDGTSMMIDTGEILGSRAEVSFDPTHQRESWMGKSLLSWLKRKKIKSLDHVVITHLHSDHAGGLRDLSHSVKIKNLYLDEYLLDKDQWLELEKTLRLKHCTLHAVRDTFSLALGKNKMKFLHPTASYPDISENNRSIVCRYDTKAQSFLFTGDIENHAELWLTKHYPDELKSDVLKVPHHGSRSSSAYEFLSQVQAQEAVFCTRRYNLYGFPHPEALLRYRDLSIRELYTYEGTLRYKTK